VDASIVSLQLGQIFRNKAEDFPGTPYLVADPERVMMWKALFATKRKPVLGIAWTGGIRETAAKYRVWNHKQMADIMRAKPGAHWVSLQYKDAESEIEQFRHDYPDIDLVQYPYATLTNDYDDMCALVASLDGVVAMQSSAVHTAGALGIPCAAGIPKTSQWRYGTDAKHMPWYNSVELFRQTQFGVWDMAGIKNWLKRF
jgi:ADP-heptose:LPS heptosyltransferase